MNGDTAIMVAEPMRTVVTFKYRDGAEIWVEVSINPEHDEIARMARAAANSKRGLAREVSGAVEVKYLPHLSKKAS